MTSYIITMVAIIASNKLKRHQMVSFHKAVDGRQQQKLRIRWKVGLLLCPKMAFSLLWVLIVFMDYEDIGAHEVKGCCFVIPAGGLGERLGFQRSEVCFASWVGDWLLCTRSILRLFASFSNLGWATLERALSVAFSHHGKWRYRVGYQDFAAEE